MGGRGLRWLVGVSFVMAALAIVANTASALSKHWRLRDYYEFSGDGCGAVDRFELSLPARAIHIRAVKPIVGTVLTDANSGNEAATITGVRIKRTDDKSVIWTATGTGAGCDSGSPDAGAWVTGPIGMLAVYDTRERAYSGGFQPRYRPHRVYFGAHEWIEKIAWSSWNGSVARGRGVYPTNDCTPSCAQGRYTRRRVSLRFFRLRWCNGRYEYLRLRYTFKGKVPHGWRDSTTVPYRCE